MVRMHDMQLVHVTLTGKLSDVRGPVVVPGAGLEYSCGSDMCKSDCSHVCHAVAA
jgi:hypothetical protein